jgi:crossover junction endodeoxyribonuclease RusA
MYRLYSQNKHSPLCDKKMIINLPWFPKQLSPNAREHWSTVTEHKKRYREACWALTKEAVGNPTIPEAGEINVRIDFYPPSNRKYDVDNLLASIKAGLDGVAQALRVDDSRFVLTICKKPEVRGMIRLTISY